MRENGRREPGGNRGRDRGPVRRLARDYVDSRRTIASYFMFVMLAVVLVIFGVAARLLPRRVAAP